MNNPINICLVGGEDAHKRIDIANILIQNQFKVTILGTQDYDYPNNIVFIKYGLKRNLSLWADLKTILEYRKIVKSNSFDIIQTFDTKPAFLVPLALFGVKVKIVRTITGLGKLFVSRNIKSLPGRILYCGLHFLVRKKVAHTTFQNIEDRDIFLKNLLITKRNHSMIYGSGINLKTIGSKALRQSKPFTLICVSRLVYEKGIVDYMKAAKICLAQKDNLRFLLVGPLEENSNRLNREIILEYSDYVEWLGQRNDIMDLLKASDAFVLPTYYREGFARVLLEASAVGLPLITTDVPGVRDIARHNKEALIVPIKNPDALAESILELAENEDLANKLSSNALNNVKKYSLEVVSKAYINLYRNIL